jgi:putative ABC transport system permease protein
VSTSARSGIRWADTVRESIVGITSRPGRAALFVIGATLGTAMLTASLLLASAASAQVTRQIDELRSTRITITQPDSPTWLETAALQRVRAIPTVVTAGKQTLTADPLPLTVHSSIASTDVPAIVGVADAHTLRSLGATITKGRLFDHGATTRRDQVVVIGAALAASLHHPRPDGRTVIWIAGRDYLLGGIYDVAPRGDPDILVRAYLPDTASLGATGARFRSPELVVNAAMGHVDTTALLAATAALPGDVSALQVSIPADPQGLRSAVTSDLQTFIEILGLVALAIGMIVTGNAALTAVNQRRVDIALRRALGVSRGAIATQFLLETGICGAAGGLLGVYLGQTATALVAIANNWPIATNLTLLPAGAAIGALCGTLAGLYPAIAAARAQPAIALRS